jgi:hypothetical protein
MRDGGVEIPATFKTEWFGVFGASFPGGPMRKYVIHGSYWLGTLCAVMAFLSRGLDTVGNNFLGFPTKGSEVGYHSYLNGAFLFYLVSIANVTLDLYISKKVPDTVPQSAPQTPGTRSSQEGVSEAEG